MGGGLKFGERLSGVGGCYVATSSCHSLVIFFLCNSVRSHLKTQQEENEKLRSEVAILKDEVSTLRQRGKKLQQQLNARQPTSVETKQQPCQGYQ